jgi:DNA adenine methylase
MGGKKALANRLIERVAAIPHKTYIEPFVGMGGVFLRRPFRAQAEVANDLNGEIVNLFRILQRHYPQLMEVMRFQIASRAEFERLRKTEPSTLTDLERAARFLYLQRLAFGGQVSGVFGVSADRPARFDLSRIGPLLDAAHDRLSGVVLECLPWQEVVARYDSPGALFYLDPPYHGGEADYGKGMFDRAEFDLMAETLRDLSGAFILSINSTPETEEIFAGFEIERVSVTYTISRDTAKQSPELIVSNRKLAGDLFSGHHVDE